MGVIHGSYPGPELLSNWARTRTHLQTIQGRSRLRTLAFNLRAFCARFYRLGIDTLGLTALPVI
jgi:hypothetical protein